MDVSSIESRLRETREKQHAQRRELWRQTLGDTTLHWAAMLPTWTSDLARRHGVEPSVELATLLVQGEKERILRVENVWLDGQMVEQFWIPREQRRELLRELRNQPPPWLLTLAKGLLDDPRQDVTRQVRAWARLLLENPWKTDPREYERFVTARVEDDLEHLGLSAAEVWVEALEDIAVMAPDWLAPVMDRLQRRLKLAYRTEQDERRLLGFIEPEGHGPTLKRLLSNDDQFWCVHFLGVGGVGKTMLMRWLTARGWKQFGYHVARVDFDYLSPDYPLRDPGALLGAVADELRIHSQSDRLDDLFDTLEHDLQSLTRLMTRENRDWADFDFFQLGEFQNVLGVFSDILERLNNVLLIFDTCEELAKLHPHGTNLPSLLMTFRIVEALHQAVPSLRIAFAGRRPLARSGGRSIEGEQPWTVVDTVERLPEQKDFLALRVMRGFNRRDADKFFDRAEERNKEAARKGGSGAVQSLDESLRATILQSCPEAGEPPRIEPAISDSTGRFNPFDLNLFTNWVLDEGEDAVRKVESGESDVYTRRRIVERLEPHLRALVPVAVILRRFDREMLATADAAQGDLEDAFRILGEQEWVQPSHEGETEILTVDRNLLPRLDRYYHPLQIVEMPDGDTVTVGELGRRIACQLVGMAPRREITRIDRHFVDVIVRWLDGRAAIEFWNDFCFLIAEHSLWSRLMDVSAYLLDSEGAIGNVERHPLRAAVDAGLCVAIHTDAGVGDLSQRWQQVLAACRDCPHDATALWLRMRATLGQRGVRFADVYRELERGDARAPLDRKLAQFRAQLLASFLAAVAREWDAAERAGQPYPAAARLAYILQAVRREIETSRSGEVLFDRAEALSLFCRAQEFRLSDDHSTADVEQILALGETSPDSRQSWFDLVLPSDVHARAALELIRRWRPPQRDKEVASLKPERWWAFLTRHFRIDVVQPNLDRERLLAAMLEWTLECELVELAEVKRLRLLYEDEPIRKPACFAHQSTPPIQLAIAAGLAAGGAPLDALRFLDDYVARGRRRIDDATRLSISRLRLCIIREFRLHRELQNIDPLLRDQALMSDALAAYVVNSPVPKSMEVEFSSALDELYARGKQPLAVQRRQGPRAAARECLAASELTPDSTDAVELTLRAMDRFAAARDGLGKLRAVTLQCVQDPAGTAAVPVSGVSWLALLEESYQEIQLPLSSTSSGAGGLPAWSELEDLADWFAQPPDADLSRVAAPDKVVVENVVENPVLGGWLLRILAMLVAVRQTGVEAPDSRFADLLKSEFPKDLPPELRRIAGMRPEPSKSWWSILGSFGTNLLSLFLALGFLCMFGVGVIYALRKIYAGASYAVTTSPTAVFLGLFIVALAGVGAGFFLWIRSRIRFRIFVFVRDNASFPTSMGTIAPHRSVEIACVLEELTITLSPFFSKHRTLAEGRWPVFDLSFFVTTVLREYENWRTQLGDSSNLPEILDLWDVGKTALASARKRAGLFDLTVEIQVPSEFAKWSWELAVRKLLRSESASRRSSRLNVIRVQPMLTSPQSPASCQHAVILENQDLAEATSPRLDYLPLHAFLERDESALSTSPLARTAVIVYGKSFQEPEGIYLRLGGSGDGRSKSSTSSEAEFSLSPRHCARSGSPLIVLVGASVDMDERTDSDRRQAELLRQAGAEIFFHAGERSVIVIPAMPRLATIAVVSSIAETLHWTDAARVASQLRSHVLYGRTLNLFEFDHERFARSWAKKLGAHLDCLVELANEICVFTRRKLELPAEGRTDSEPD